MTELLKQLFPIILVIPAFLYILWYCNKPFLTTYLNSPLIKEIANEENTTVSNIKTVFKDTGSNVLLANRFGLSILIVFFAYNAIPYIWMILFLPTFNLWLFGLICFIFSWLGAIFLQKIFKHLAKRAGAQYACIRYRAYLENKSRKRG